MFVNISYIDLIIPATALFTTALLCSQLIVPINFLARVKGLLDMPGERSSHKKKTPRLGGVSLFISVIAIYLFFSNSQEYNMIKYGLLATLIMFFVGLRDDLLPLSPLFKFVPQLICAFLITYAGYRIDFFFGIFGIGSINPVLSVFLSILIIVYLINSINLVDGVDGLCLSLSMLYMFVFFIFFILSNEYNFAILTAITIGAIIPLYIFNVFGKRNKTFIGDCGSLTLGTLITICTLKFYQINVANPENLWFEATPALLVSLLSIPIFDTLRVFCLRLFRRKSPFSPDRTHLHHLVLNMGCTHLQTSIILSLFSLTAIIITLSLSMYLHPLLLIFINIILIYGLTAIVWLIGENKQEKEAETTLIGNPD